MECVSLVHTFKVLIVVPQGASFMSGYYPHTIGALGYKVLDQ